MKSPGLYPRDKSQRKIPEVLSKSLRMPALETAFNQLEARLQSLVEGSLSRLFPAPAWQAELVRSLTGALRRDVRSVNVTGSLLAPDHFMIYLPPSQARLFIETPDLLAALAEYLRQAAQEAGFLFSMDPSLRVIAAPEADARHIQVVTQFSQDHSGQTEFLSTVPVAVDIEIPSGAFLIIDGGKMYPLTQAVTNIGRLKGNDLVIPDGRISRRHAQLRLAQPRFMLFDLGSSGGTYVNGRKITQCALQPGDIISLAGVALVFGCDSSDSTGPTQEIISHFD
jgi:hypothetical protein